MDSTEKLLILGLGISGRAVAELALAQGKEVFALEEKCTREDPELLSLIKRGMHLLSSPEEVEVQNLSHLLPSPGVPPHHPLLQKAMQRGVRVEGELDYALRHYPGPIVGITGTNGKTTTTLLTVEALRKGGLEAEAYGNIGKPLCRAILEQKRGIAVVEMSSFQLHFTSAVALEGALLLNITENHLDWHPFFAHYAAAKWKISTLCHPHASCWISPALDRAFPGVAEAYGARPFSAEAVEAIKEVEYRKNPNVERENLIGAALLCHSLGLSFETFLEAAASFSPPPHRMELVARWSEGITFINDSKATNVAAVIRAVKAVKGGKIHLIAGGRDKGGSYDPWRSLFPGRVAQIYAIGEAQKLIAQALGDLLPVHLDGRLEVALRHAVLHSEPGATILLSPGCSSLDQFRDYQERGFAFSQGVLQMERERCVGVIQS